MDVLAQDFDGAIKLDAMFALHPNLKNVAQMYAAKEAMFVHAVASPYRDRSHFDAQNVLETGGSAAYQLKDGWLNRMLQQMPGLTAETAYAIGHDEMLLLKGEASVANWSNASSGGVSRMA